MTDKELRKLSRLELLELLLEATEENEKLKEINGKLIVVFKDDPVTGECFGAKYSNVDFTIDFNATVGSTQ